MTLHCCVVAAVSLQEGKRMESDPLTTSGYFSEFSWYSLDDDDPREMSMAPFEELQMRVAPEELPLAYREKAQSPEDDAATRAD
jgi:hypothetical protein